MRIVLSLMFVLSFVSLANAMTDKEVSTGKKAEQLFNKIPGEAHLLGHDPEFSRGTTIKVWNLSRKNTTAIQFGDRGIICDHYVNADIIKDVGSDYFCHLIDLTDEK